MLAAWLWTLGNKYKNGSSRSWQRDAKNGVLLFGDNMSSVKAEFRIDVNGVSKMLG